MFLHSHVTYISSSKINSKRLQATNLQVELKLKFPASNKVYDPGFSSELLASLIGLHQLKQKIHFSFKPPFTNYSFHLRTASTQRKDIKCSEPTQHLLQDSKPSRGNCSNCFESSFSHALRQHPHRFLGEHNKESQQFNNFFQELSNKSQMVTYPLS